VRISSGGVNAALPRDPAGERFARDSGCPMRRCGILKPSEADRAVCDPANFGVAAHKVEAALAAVENAECQRGLLCNP